MKNLKFFIYTSILSAFIFASASTATADEAERALYDQIREAVVIEDQDCLREIALNFYLVKQGVRPAFMIDKSVRKNLGESFEETIENAVEELDLHMIKGKESCLIISKEKISKTKAKKNDGYVEEKLGNLYTGFLGACSFIDRTSYSYHAAISGEKILIMTFAAPSTEMLKTIKKHEGKKIAEQIESLQAETERMREHFEVAVKEIDEEATVSLDIEEIPASEKVPDLDEAISQFKDYMESLWDKVSDGFKSIFKF